MLCAFKAFGTIFSGGSGTCLKGLGHFWDTFGIYRGHTWDVCGGLGGCVWNNFEICLVFVLQLFWEVGLFHLFWEGFAGNKPVTQGKY